MNIGDQIQVIKDALGDGDCMIDKDEKRDQAFFSVNTNELPFFFELLTLIV